MGADDDGGDGFDRFMEHGFEFPSVTPAGNEYGAMIVCCAVVAGVSAFLLVLWEVVQWGCT